MQMLRSIIFILFPYLRKLQSAPLKSLLWCIRKAPHVSRLQITAGVDLASRLLQMQYKFKYYVQDEKLSLPFPYITFYVVKSLISEKIFLTALLLKWMAKLSQNRFWASVQVLEQAGYHFQRYSISKNPKIVIRYDHARLFIPIPSSVYFLVCSMFKLETRWSMLEVAEWDAFFSDILIQAASTNKAGEPSTAKQFFPSRMINSIRN